MSIPETPQPEPSRPSLKEFVRKNTTPTACAVTAVGTAYLTRSFMIDAGKTVFQGIGQQHMLDVIQRDILFDFITEKNLTEDFVKYTETLPK